METIRITLLFLISLVLCGCVYMVPVKKRVCVIGAGISGLSTARYLHEEGINFTLLEATQHVGGVWRYVPNTGTDEYGLPLFTSMYKHLRTNLPKPTMQLNGFPFKENTRSFMGWEDYYEYLKDFAKHYNLYEHIKFLHLVQSVKREGEVWKIKHKYLPTGEEFEHEYDFVVVGTGHYSKPNYPVIPNEDLFNGTIIHSHDYREFERYRNRKVVVVGAGPSGLDIGLHVAKVSSRLIHSHHSKVNFETPFPAHYVRKPDIKEFKENGVVFVDGSFEEADDVIYCTGFKYDYSFLDPSCGLQGGAKYVGPLYRRLVNAAHPTMMVPGLVVRACLALAIDAQARYSVALIKGNFTLPPREQMLAEWRAEADGLVAKGLPLSHLHLLSYDEDQYYEDLSKEAGISRVAPVMAKIRQRDMRAKIHNFYTFRDYAYTLIDDENFIRHLESEPATNATVETTTPAFVDLQ